MKKKVILLPLIMMALASCGGNNSTEPKPSTSNSTSTSTSAKPSTSTSTKPSESTSTVTPAKEYGIVDTPVVGTAYRLGYKHKQENKVLYLKGDVAASYYIDSADSVANSDDVYIEEATGGYYLYFVRGTTKTYINARINGNYKNILMEATASTVWKYKAEWKTLVTDLDETTTVYIGSYSDKTTFSVSTISHVVDDTSYISHFYAEGATGTEPTYELEKVDVTGVTADESIEVEVGRSKKINASVTPANATEKGLTYKSNDETKATVDADGNVKGVAEGNATITVASKDDATKFATVNVTVKAASGEVGVEDKTAKFDFATNIGNFPTSQGGTEVITHKVEDIELSFSAGANYSTKYSELYIVSNGTVNFAGADGVTVKKVIIEFYKFDNWSVYASADCSGDVISGTLTDGTIGSSAHVTKEYEVNAATFSFKNTYTGGSGALWSITIEYTK